MYFKKASVEECRALAFTLGGVNGNFKEPNVSKQQSQMEREHQIPQSKMSNIIPQQTKGSSHYWQIFHKSQTEELEGKATARYSNVHWSY